MGSSGRAVDPLDNGLAPIEPKRRIGIVGNVAHQESNWLFSFPSYELAIVEFDDQGCCHDRTHLRGLARKLSELDENAKDAIIIAFAHGWKHDARSDDDILAHFTHLLEQAVYYEEQQAKNQTPPQPPRSVLGVFAGWRGMSLYDDYFHVLEEVTFWNRQKAARRVATGSVRELYGYLHQYRENRKAKGGRPLVVIVGHSFGGVIVYSALAQSLIEAAAMPLGRVTPSFADLILLVNPAFEAARYLPVQALVDERQSTREALQQPPVFVCATGQNDWATRFAFPVGNALSLLTEKWKNPHERQAILHTIGHISWMKTHDLAADSGTGAATSYALSPPAPGKITTNPFWVIRATPEVINGHGGVFQTRFLTFIADLVFAHADDSARREANVQFLQEAHALAPTSP
jgi:pimeloyl-ACP methyl ester carboxylesterase